MNTARELTLSETTSRPHLNPQKAEKAFIPALDGIRGLAILWVVVLHFSYARLPGGFIGVDLFFVLSGFLITRILTLEQAQFGTVNLRHFYLRRIFRLWPAFLVAIALSGALVHPPYSANWRHAALLGFLNIANFFKSRLGSLEHTWSLSIEEQFYLLWPLVLVGALRKGGVKFAFGLSVGLALLSAAVRVSTITGVFSLRPSFELYSFTPARIDGLLLGAAAGLFSLTPRGAMAARHITRSGIRELVLLACVPILLWVQNLDPRLYTYGFLLLNIAFATLVLGCTDRSHPFLLDKALTNPWLSWAGRRSYGIYLYHFPIYAATDSMRIPGDHFSLLWVSALRLTLSVAAAEISYRCIERPFLKLKSRLTPHAQNVSVRTLVSHESSVSNKIPRTGTSYRC